MIAVFRIVFVVLWSILMISSSILIYLFTWNSRIPVAMARHQWAPGVLWLCGIRLKRFFEQRIDPTVPYVIVSNHQSFLDIPILFMALPLNLYFVAKKELKHIPFLGWYMVVTGMIFVDRSNRQKSIISLQKAAKLIKKGKAVLMFPEGTRNTGPTMGAIKKGPFLLAKQAEVATIPVGIRFPSGLFQLNGWGITQAEVHVGHPIDSGRDRIVELIKTNEMEMARLSAKEPAQSPNA